MSFALLFSGQGNQHPAMLPWLADDDTVRDMRARLGVDDWRRALADPRWAERNDNAQTLLTCLALAAWAQLAPMVAAPDAIAGYSVGELAAFSAAGVLAADSSIELAQQRARAMDACAALTPGGLLAVTGISERGLERLRAEAGVEVAIRNSGPNVIVGGPLEALEDAERMALAAGAQCARLRVNVASHTSWMRPAAERFSRTLEKVPFLAPGVVLFSNAADRIRNASSAKAALAAQIAQTVRWDECMENIMARQVRCVLEIGPGQALARMWNQRWPAVPARACDDFRTSAAVAAWLRSHADR